MLLFASTRHDGWDRLAVSGDADDCTGQHISSRGIPGRKHAALRYILDAWEEAVYDGLDSDCIATAAIFAALSDLIASYGGELVAHLAAGLPERIRAGEFTVNRTTQ